MSVPVKYHDLGSIRYQEAWDLQETLLKENVVIKTENRKQELDPPVPTVSHLLFCEHPHVYTLGKSGDKENVLLSDEELAEKGIEFFKINRGGDITYHGPGQIVGYPIFDLEVFKPDIHLYLRNLEEACIKTLADYGLEAGRIDGLTGVWLDIDGPDPRKILAIGVRCSRWITMHGFAFNVNTDLDYFGHIVPCGIDDKGVTSLQAELGQKMDMEEVKMKMRGHMADLFGFHIA
ncbi:MAG: lipoyl(octanoyl) transferase LipB [Bacteroidota bacterium]